MINNEIDITTGKIIKNFFFVTKKKKETAKVMQYLFNSYMCVRDVEADDDNNDRVIFITNGNESQFASGRNEIQENVQRERISTFD